MEKMDINTTKLMLVQQLLETDSEKLLRKIKKLIEEEIEPSAISKEHKKILDERLALHKSNPKAGSSWKTVKKRIKAGL